MARLRADIWCSAFVRRHNDLSNLCVISRKGDASAGQIWVEVDHLDGTMSLFTPASAMHVGGDRDMRLFEQRYLAVQPEQVRERILREAEFDPDFWVVSLETRAKEFGLDLVSDRET